MRERDPGLQAALDAAGGERALARALGVARQTIQAWTKVPADRVVQIEIATGVPRETLRPDLYR